MRQKLADFFADDLDIRYIGLVVGKRNQGHVIEELLKHVNDYIVPVTITRATLKRWLSACMNDCLVWEQLKKRMVARRRAGKMLLPRLLISRHGFN